MRDHLNNIIGEPSLQKVVTSVALTVGNALGGITLDGTYKVLLFALALANLVWAVLNIRKLRRDERSTPTEKITGDA